MLNAVGDNYRCSEYTQGNRLEHCKKISSRDANRY